MLGERKNISAPLAQRRNRKREYVQAEVQIFAKTTRFDSRRKVHIRQGDDARFDAQRFRAAQAFKRPLLQNTEQLALRVGGKRRHLIENNRPVAAQFKTSELALDRAGKGPTLMSEKLTFDQLRRQTGAINFQIRRVPARAKFMNQPREVVLPGAAFTGYEKRRRCHRDFLGKLQQSRRGRVFRDPRQTLSGHVRERPPWRLEMRPSE